MWMNLIYAAVSHNMQISFQYVFHQVWKGEEANRNLTELFCQEGILSCMQSTIFHQQKSVLKTFDVLIECEYPYM